MVTKLSSWTTKSDDRYCIFEILLKSLGSPVWTNTDMSGTKWCIRFFMNVDLPPPDSAKKQPEL
jgi:hypothetical protein